jgi:hypothetical protein
MLSGISGAPHSQSSRNCRVWVCWVDGEPKIVAGGVHVAPFNTELRHRAQHDGATGKRPTCHGLRTTLADWRGRGASSGT